MSAKADREREKIAEEARWNVGLLAEDLGVSPRQLNRWFHQRFSVSAREFFDASRMRRAKELLADPAIKIASVAEAVAYAHSSHFATAFKRRFGVSPSSYRRSRMSENGTRL